MTLQILPPRSPGRQITIDGYAVPRLEVAEDAATGQWHVTYDGRFGVVAENLEELQRWLWIVAQAQAVGEGYSCHGENSVYRPNPHQVKVMQIGTSEPT
jgi:hypothetical protein